MTSKRRAGLQIRFNTDSEQDLIEFFSPLKKTEVHITAVSAFRMYMRSIGFYEKSLLENKLFQTAAHKQQERECEKSGIQSIPENLGIYDEEAFKTLDDMFENEDELNN